MPREIALIGAGMGTPESLTAAAAGALAAADCLIGAARLLKGLAGEKPAFAAVSPGEIRGILESHPEFLRPAVLFSGDGGFYSGARLLRQELAGWQIREYPGVSSLAYFCAAIHQNWEDAYLLSLHGRQGNLAAAAARHPKVFLLTDREHSPQALCRQLTEEGLGQAEVFVGERLGAPEERIRQGRAESLAKEEFGQPSVMLVCARPMAAGGFGLRDECFVRGRVPMTKSEVRALVLSRLGMQPGDIAYDIGAGTGSISVEMALAAWEGQVYAVEQNPQAAELIRENRRRLGAFAIQVVEGRAPAALAELPAPDKAVIGGSGGSLGEILALLLDKNPAVRVVITAITPETVSQALAAIRALPMGEPEILTITAARGRAAGGHTLMMGQNPVWIITAEGDRHAH